MDHYPFLVEAFRELNQKMDFIVAQVAKINKNELLPEKWLDPGEVCRALKISKRTLGNYQKCNRIPRSRIDGKIYYKAEDVAKHLENNYNKNGSKK